MKHVGDGGQRLHHDAADRQRRFDLPQRDPSLARHDGPQVVRVLLQQGTPVAPNLRWRCAAGLAHPLHQLDGRRGAHGKAAGRLPDRAATLDNSHDPLTQVLGQRCGHDQLHRSHPQNLRIRSFDSVQGQTALARGHTIADVAAVTSFVPRWAEQLLARYNAKGPDELGDLRRRNGGAPSVLRPELLARLPERLATPPSDGGLWTGPKVARWMASELGLAEVLPQRGWEALKAIGWSVQKPRPRHPASATPEDS